jgi:DNA-binding beta-propeller fold protein YncE
MAFDSRGNLYVANSANNLILEFNSSGLGSVFASTGLNGPSYIAIIPEPSVWEILVLSASALLIFRRRR